MVSLKDLYNNFRILRYEDLAYNPMEKAEEIYKYIDVEMPYGIKSWIRYSTQTKVDHNKNSFYTVRDSKPRQQQNNGARSFHMNLLWK
jgi:hypothetical protein